MSYGITFSGADALNTLGSFLSMSAVGVLLMLTIGALIGPQLLDAIHSLWSSK